MIGLKNSNENENDLDIKKTPALILSSPKRPATTPINFYEIESDDSVIVTDVKKPKAKNNLSVLLVKMHNRIIKKARVKLTKTILEKIEDTGKSFTTKQEEMFKLKDAIVTLEQSEANGNHLNVIRTVTNNGQHFYDDTSSLSSDDVLERVMMYHTI